MSRVSGSRLSRIIFLIVPILALSAFVYGCSGAQSDGSSDRGDHRATEETSAVTTNVEETSESAPNAEETTAETGDASADEAGQANGSQDSNASGDAGIALTPKNEVTVSLDGDEGVRFSGSCTVNGERERIKGSVPESFDYRTEDGGAVECVLRKRGGEGNFNVTMESGGRRSVQQTNSENGEIRISTSGSSATSSTSTSSSSSSSVVSNQSNSSVTITQNNSSSGGD